MCKESTEPIYVTKNGYGDMVIMSMKAYEERLWLLDVEDALYDAETDIRTGRTVDAKAGVEALREKYGL